MRKILGCGLGAVSFGLWALGYGLWAVGLGLSAYAEDMTITTYYPAPYGDYEQLKVKRMGVGQETNGSFLDLTGSAAIITAKSNATGETTAIGAETTANNGIGVYGFSKLANPASYTYGVIGHIESPGGAAVYGDSTSTADAATTYGVVGKTVSPGGAGVYGENKTGATYGVYGKNVSNTTGAAGVFGENTSGTGQVYGVYGSTRSGTDNTVGVFGESLYYDSKNPRITHGVVGRTLSNGDFSCGVRGVAESKMGNVVGVYGDSNSPDGYAAYFAGKTSTGANRNKGVYVNGDLEVNGNIKALNIPRIEYGEKYFVSPSGVKMDHLVIIFDTPYPSGKPPVVMTQVKLPSQQSSLNNVPAIYNITEEGFEAYWLEAETYKSLMWVAIGAAK